MSSLKETLERLYGLIPKGRKLGLERMQAACDHFDNPERSFDVVHVGGTNGKGSVCAFAASMLRQAELGKIGMFTSPHLNRFAERIQVDGQPISDDEVVRVINRVMDETPELTFFETTTLAAFLAFQKAGVKLAVLEVGLGGRLDATNVVPTPKVTAITRISFDHMAELGDSLRKIGEEKAGIIKPKTKLVLGKLHPDARQAIEARAKEVGAEIVPLGSAEPYPGAQLAYPRMAMFGTNLAVASTIARELGVSNEQIGSGIEDTMWPGRNELLHRNGQELTLLDCCHNPDSGVLLGHIVDATAAETVGSRRGVVLVFGTVQDKNWKAILARLENSVGHRVYVKPEINKAADPHAMAQVYPGEVANSVGEALQMARAHVGPRGLVVVTGSIFLVGPARAVLLGLPTDPPVDM